MVSGRLNAILVPAYQLTARMCSAQCYSQPSAIFCALIGMTIKFSTWLAKCPSDFLRGLPPGQPIVLANYHSSMQTGMASASADAK